MANLIRKIRPIEQKATGMCGPAALRSLLSYFDKSYSEKYLARLCHASNRYGAKPQHLKGALERLGFGTECGSWQSKQSSWRTINHWVNGRGLPVLVDWFSKFDGHYSIVVRLSRKSIWLADPEYHRKADRIRKIRWDDFVRVWFDFDGDYLVKDSIKTFVARWWLVAYPAPLAAMNPRTR